MVIVQHCAHSAKDYSEATPFPGHLFAVPDRCPHPDCRAADALIRWGTYEREARTGLAVYHIRVQRVRCKVCGRTHSLLPDFLHPYRHYVISLLQRVVFPYILAGLGINRLMERLIGQGPVRSTVREWIVSFAYGAGHLLLELYNPTTAQVDLSGWHVGDVGPAGEHGSGLYQFPVGATLAPEGVIVLAKQAADVPFVPDYEFLIDPKRGMPACPTWFPRATGTASGWRWGTRATKCCCWTLTRR